ncbi:hypothetical protein [Haliangium ochraceum]|uniref:Transporter n=1 Tax=Haliangium ochraceum (strain DSM 14365 / JCM 11303 / SMP-2) TaxID=502025 RepID=D0LQ50_HALO1|nr:hypothetical protein [Haliangium ochraceum]ACY17087.1 hypothetical protein Hoch_4596 [Haliangium ochraceum DSM 14365]
MSILARSILGASALLLLQLPALDAAAQQAWVPEPGSLSINLDYAYSRSDFVVENGEELSRNDYPEGTPVPIDPTFSHGVVLSAEYAPIERLGIVANVPVMTTRYDYPGADQAAGEYTDLPPHGANDDGDYHTALQDFRLDVRYAVSNDLLGFSPHIGVSIPMSDYETVGYGAIGRGLKQLILGAAVGKFFVSGVPGLYLHGHYEFHLVESYETEFAQTAEYGQNRSLMDAFVGYYILDNLDVNLLGVMQLAHGGFEFEEWDGDFDGEAANLPTILFHDALLAESFFQAGAGITYRPIEGMRVGLSMRWFVWGKNTRNADYYGVSVGYDIL